MTLLCSISTEIRSVIDGRGGLIGSHALATVTFLSLFLTVDGVHSGVALAVSTFLLGVDPGSFVSFRLGRPGSLLVSVSHVGVHDGTRRSLVRGLSLPADRPFVGTWVPE